MQILGMKSVALCLTIGVLTVGVAPLSKAAEVTATGVIVNSVLTAGDGSFFITLSSNHPSCLNTNNPKRHYVRVGNYGITAEGAKMLYAAALMALATERDIAVAFDDADNSCALLRLLMG